MWESTLFQHITDVIVSAFVIKDNKMEIVISCLVPNVLQIGDQMLDPVTLVLNGHYDVDKGLFIPPQTRGVTKTLVSPPLENVFRESLMLHLSILGDVEYKLYKESLPLKVIQLHLHIDNF